ncbi:MAG: chorismate synthase [Pyrinomonadaceae bacterium]|nr:chorismate synthase [Phycisphaerales bacterium]
MPTLSYQTAGESHGPALVTIVSGLPAGLPLDMDFINAELARRQGGYGRGARQRIETDTAEILSGVRLGKTIGSPVTLLIRNNDSRLDDTKKTPPVHIPRPGHADFAGSVKYLTTDCRETLERASARETAARTAAGAVAKLLLRHIREEGTTSPERQRAGIANQPGHVPADARSPLDSGRASDSSGPKGIEVLGFVRSILDAATTVRVQQDNWQSMLALRDASETYCPDEAVTAKQCQIIRQAKIDKDTVGGLVEAHVFGCPPGLGSTMNWQDRLDARLASAVMGIQAFKAVEIGLGKDSASRPGSQVHDAIRFDPARKDTSTLGFERDSNNAGGTEGGMTNGMPIVVRGTMKPIATLLRGMPSVDLNTKEAKTSEYERSDICAVSAASVVMENVVAFEVARVVLEKFGGDTLGETVDNFSRFMQVARMLPLE